MGKFLRLVLVLAVALAGVACATGSGHPAGADAGLGGRTAGGAAATGGTGGSDAGMAPSACGAFTMPSPGRYATATLQGPVYVYANAESTIAIYAAATSTPVCAKGKIASTVDGNPGYGYLNFDVNAVFGTVSSADEDAGTDAGAVTSSTAWETYIPQGDGLIVNLDNKAHSNLWLCLIGVDFDQWCLQEVTDGAFYRWSDFADNWGSGVSYTKQPLLSIHFTAPGNAGAFDFCVNGFVEAAGFCACPDGTCNCPTGTNACNGTCVPDTAVNPLNCGTCGKVCPGSGACRDGECVDSVLGAIDLPDSLAIDGDTLYFTQFLAGTVEKADLNDGTLDGGIPEVIASGQNTPTRIVVAGGTVYWVNAGTDANNYADGSIMKLVGNVPTLIAEGQNNVVGLAVDSKFAYWASGGTKSKQYADGAIFKKDLASSPSDAPTSVTTTRPHPRGIAVDSNNLYWVEQGTGDWSQYASNGRVLKIALDAAAGTQPTPLAENLLSPMAIAVDATNVYVGCADKVLKVALADKKSMTLATGQSQPFTLVVDATDVYWTNHFGGSLVTVPIAGGTPPVTLARGQNYAVGLALSATDVYWATRTDTLLGGIQKASK